ncbi:MAG: hypothetical protein JWP34_5129, partial [Massilia sp.]|nr:hypothetical protein [Massilia sp.]
MSELVNRADSAQQAQAVGIVQEWHQPARQSIMKFKEIGKDQEKQPVTVICVWVPETVSQLLIWGFTLPSGPVAAGSWNGFAAAVPDRATGVR